MSKTTVAHQIRKMSGADLRSDLDLTTAELHDLLDLAAEVKRAPDAYAKSLSNRSLALLFEKPSLRTRLTFELAIQQLGGHVVSVTGMIGDREPLKDVARNLDRWTNGIVARVFSQSTIDELAHWSRVPVINALSDRYHPCQIFADLQTVQERFGTCRGLKLAYIGDGNNVAHSLLLSATRAGMHVTIACPDSYHPSADIVALAGNNVTVVSAPAAAVEDAHVVYTDVWASMGQETEAAYRQQLFSAYQVDSALMRRARPDAIFLHCLPAKRGQEVTDEVMESSQSAIFDQAENRLHAQKALLLMLLS